MQRLRSCALYFAIAIVVLIVLSVIGAMRPDTPAAEPAAVPVPTFTPTAQAVVVPASIQTDANADYRREVVARSAGLADGLIKIGELMQAPQLNSEAWTLDMALGIVLIQSAHQELEKLQPPAEFADFHAQLLDGSGTCNTFASTLAAAIDNEDSAMLGISVDLLNQCTSKINAAAAAIPQ